MRILVVGGTRYFGIPMVNALLAKGHDVTIGTRGNTKVNFKGDVSHVIFDRTDSTSVKRALDNRKYDVIIDKIAYSSNDVKKLLENVSCERYIQMSTCSVYHKDHANISEDEFVANGWTDDLNQQQVDMEPDTTGLYNQNDKQSGTYFHTSEN